MSATRNPGRGGLGSEWLGAGPSAGLQLPSGRLLGAVNSKVNGQDKVFVISSDDHGLHWQRSSFVPQGTSAGLGEASIALNGSDVVMLIRASDSALCHHFASWSSTEGDSWAAATPVIPSAPSCSGSVLALDNKDVVAVLPSSVDRTVGAKGSSANLSLWLAPSEGVAGEWTAVRVLYTGCSAYSSMSHGPAGDEAEVLFEGVFGEDDCAHGGSGEFSVALTSFKIAASSPVTTNTKTDDYEYAGLLRSYAIVLDPNATAVERFASQELRSLLCEMSAAGGDACSEPVLPVLDPAAARAANVSQLAVGPGAALALGVAQADLQQTALGEEGYRLCSVDHTGSFSPARIRCGGAAGPNGPHVALAGAPSAPRGSLYAVYDYLERLGVRFFAPDETLTPPLPRAGFFRLPPANSTFVPRFEYRDSNEITAITTGYRDPLAMQLWAVRLRYNVFPNTTVFNNTPIWHTVRTAGQFATPPGFVHTSYNFFTQGGKPSGLGGPPQQWFQSHNEWFYPHNDSTVYGQLCWSNTSLVQYLIEKTRGFLRLPENAAATTIDVSQNDNAHACQDPAEKAIAEEEGSPMGPLLRAVNAIADAIKEEFPGVAVSTLAYAYTRPVPLHTKPRSNVIIRYATEPGCCDYRAPIPSYTAESEPVLSGANPSHDLSAWAKVTDRIHVWDYMSNFNNFL